MKERRGIDVLVGAFMLLGLGALLFLALKVGNLGTFSTGAAYEAKARFDNIGGLKVRAPVKSAGVVVGRVVSIGFDDTTYQAVVVMALEERFRFPKDSSVKILTSGLLGEQYIGMEAGAEDKMLAAGDTITLTQSAVVLENLISQFLFSRAAEGEKKE
jgi:phospholipid/cholesterol/gamma-HCH transport system substrate-binding protein